jgi:hypothetical protein
MKTGRPQVLFVLANRNGTHISICRKILGMRVFATGRAIGIAEEAQFVELTS